jgi:dihydrofolate reductase
MRRVVYSVAMSLDGFIAGPKGEYDWIPMDPSIDWKGFMGRFDTILLGRKTYEMTGASGPATPKTRTVVFSSTLTALKDSKLTLVREDAAGFVNQLRQESGKEIWLMGGGGLFRSLLEAGQVDVVEVGLIPILLGKGIPFLPPTDRRQNLTLTKVEKLAATGTVRLSYNVAGVCFYSLASCDTGTARRAPREGAL